MAAAKRPPLLFWFILGWLTVLLAGCSQPATSTIPAAVASATPSATLAPTNTSSPPSSTALPASPVKTATRTPVPGDDTPPKITNPSDDPASQVQETGTSTPAGPQAVAWNQAIDTPYILPMYSVAWSPVENRLVGVRSVDAEAGKIGLTSAPDFQVQSVEIDPFTFYSSAFTWSLDGRRIFFGGPVDGASQEYPVEEYHDLWVMDQSGKDPHLLTPEVSGTRFLQFLGWMDPTTLVIQEYNGGGHHTARIVDTRQAKVLAEVSFQGCAYTPNPHFVPLIGGYAGAIPRRIFVLSRFVQDKPMDLTFNILFFQPNEYYGIEFKPEGLTPGTGFVYRGWQPDSDRMLVLAYQDNQEGQTTLFDLLLWSVNSGATRMLVKSGLDGLFSPDGQLLAVIITGKPAVVDGILTFEPALDGPPHLVLLHNESRRVLFSSAAFLDVSKFLFNLDFCTGEVSLAFSPDGRYLAFPAPEEGQAQPDGGPVFLSVLDTETRQVLTRLSYAPDAEFSWSPSSRYLVYRSPDKNWNLFDTKKMISVALTEYAGDFISSPRWSFDGHYLSFRVRVAGWDEAPTINYSAIFAWP